MSGSGNESEEYQDKICRNPIVSVCGPGDYGACHVRGEFAVCEAFFVRYGRRRCGGAFGLYTGSWRRFLWGDRASRISDYIGLHLAVWSCPGGIFLCLLCTDVDGMERIDFPVVRSRYLFLFILVLMDGIRAHTYGILSVWAVCRGRACAKVFRL